jgi:peptidylprolyl isomerase/peptidyl-prolyl isomerase G (cyclophilin G)
VRPRSPPPDRRRSLSRSASPNGRIRRGRGFSQRFSYARRYRTSPSPDRSPYRFSDRSDRDR